MGTIHDYEVVPRRSIASARSFAARFELAGLRDLCAARLACPQPVHGPVVDQRVICETSVQQADGRGRGYRRRAGRCTEQRLDASAMGFARRLVAAIRTATKT